MKIKDLSPLRESEEPTAIIPVVSGTNPTRKRRIAGLVSAQQRVNAVPAGQSSVRLGNYAGNLAERGEPTLLDYKDAGVRHSWDGYHSIEFIYLKSGVLERTLVTRAQWDESSASDPVPVGVLGAISIYRHGDSSFVYNGTGTTSEHLYEIYGHQIVFDILSFETGLTFLFDLSNAVYVSGRRFTYQLPRAIGGIEPYTYRVTGLVGDLSFDETNLRITGTAQVVNGIRYIVTDAIGETHQDSFDIGLYGALSLPSSIGQSFPQRPPLTVQFGGVSGGVPPYSYQAWASASGILNPSQDLVNTSFDSSNLTLYISKNSYYETEDIIVDSVGIYVTDSVGQSASMTYS